MGQLQGTGKDEQAFADALPTGTVLREYVVETVIGRGGYGVVYRARDRYLGRVVALKEYFPTMLAVRTEGTVRPRNRCETSDYEDGLRRFLEEARRLEQFRSHPGVVTCLGFFKERGTAYLAMEYEDGLPLSELLMNREADANPLSEEELLRLAEQLIESLAAVHEAGVLHRDIKPSNILVRRSDERPVLIDFGAAKTDFARHTKSNAPQTLGYAAVEQVEEDGDLGPWTDLYGLGGVLWRIVAGGQRQRHRLVPVDALSRLAAKFRGQEDPQPSAWKLGSGRFSRGVLEAIDKCLELEPRDRPADCEELLALLPVPVKEDLVESRDLDTAKEDGRREQSRSGGEVKPPPEYGIEQGGRVRVLADRGLAVAQSALACMYYHGEGVPKDLALAAAWHRKAADQGHAVAQNWLGRMYYCGEGVPKDFALAAVWCRKAAQQGNAAAQSQLGHMYYRGEGVPKDVALAVEWCRKAAEQGNAVAQGQLGHMYCRGEGVPKDLVLGAMWRRKAAEQRKAADQAISRARRRTVQR